jgi:sporulation protein YlmC with PRC-barrel domain
MRASDLLEKRVVDAGGNTYGKVRDLHIVQDGPMRSSGHAALRLHGLVAGRFAIATRLGYETRPGIPASDETRGPLPIRAFVRWLHRNAKYISWDDIIRIDDDTILVRG